MPSPKDVEAELEESGLNLAGAVIEDAGNNGSFFAFVEIERGPDLKQTPSNYLLNLIAADFKKREINLSFVLVEKGSEDIQGSIKTILFRSFPEAIRNSFTTFDGNKASVWIEPKRLVTDNEEKEIEEKIREFLNILNITLASIRVTTSVNLATPTAVLRTLRIAAPVSGADLRLLLTAKGFVVPNEAWLSHLLDRLRKSQKVIRQKNGHYALTLDGLKSLGSEKRRNSPDVIRALDLSKRGA